jgi:hypothetical protein
VCLQNNKIAFDPELTTNELQTASFYTQRPIYTEDNSARKGFYRDFFHAVMNLGLWNWHEFHEKKYGLGVFLCFFNGFEISDREKFE